MSRPPAPRSTPGLVSIVIPCFNPGPYLADALASAREQTHAAVEVIVVDDGSTEDLRPIVDAVAGVRYVRQRNRGVSAARNRGARESRGEFLVFLDADDRLLPDAVRTGLDELARLPDAALAAGLCYPVGPQGDPLPFKQQAPITGDPYVAMLQGNFIWMPAQVIYRRLAFEDLGGFDGTVDACADYDLYLRATRERPVVCHRALVAEYRFHDGNMSGDKALMLASALQVLDRQWGFVRRRREYRVAYDEGRRFWREYYGSGLVEDIRADVRHSPVRAVRRAAVLLRHHPTEALRQLGRKIRRVVLDLAGSR